MFRSIVKSQFENPNLALAFLFIAMPSVLLIAVKLLIGISPDLVQFSLSIAKEIIFVGIVSLALYALLIIVKGKSMHAPFASVFCAYSVIYLVIFVAALISFILVSFFIAGFFTKVAALQNTQATFDEVTNADLALALDILRSSFEPDHMFLGKL